MATRESGRETGVAERRAASLASLRARRSRISVLLGLARQKPLGAFGLMILVVMLLGATFAPLLAPYGYNETDLLNRLQGPSLSHWFGTDGSGRDMLSRVIYGARVSVYVGFGAVAIGTVCATLLGMVSGYFGGVFDIMIQRVVDAIMAFPTLLLLITIMSVLGPGQLNVMIGLGIASMAGNSRVMRSAVLATKEAPYIEAARCIGCRDTRVLARHILPNITAPMIILATLGLAFAILAEASLSFLGFGVPPPAPSWGGMLSGVGRSYFLVAPWIAIFPGLAISLVVFGINMFGDALRDVLDPRLRGGTHNL
ncbi:MAG: ABC transporter permease [Dehalococcoidia bacterium]